MSLKAIDTVVGVKALMRHLVAWSLTQALDANDGLDDRKLALGAYVAYTTLLGRIEGHDPKVLEVEQRSIVRDVLTRIKEGI